MDRSSQSMGGSENIGQYPTEEEIVDPYLNETAYLQDYSVGIPREDQGSHHDNNFYSSQERQLEQRGRHLGERDFIPRDAAMGQDPGSLSAFNLEVTQSGRPSSFDPDSLFSRIPEMDKEGLHRGSEEGALQPPTRLELAGVGRHGSLYYKAASPGRYPGQSPRRSGALRQHHSRYQIPQISEEKEENPPYSTDQEETGGYGHRDRPTPGQGRLDQRRASDVSLNDGNRQLREEASVKTTGDARIHTGLAAPSSMAHSRVGQVARSENYPSVSEISNPGSTHNPEAAQAKPGSESSGRPISSSTSPESQRNLYPQEQRSPAPGSHVPPPLQEHQATASRGTPQRTPQSGLQPQRQDQTASMPANRSRSPQRAPTPAQGRVLVTADPTRHSQSLHPSAAAPSPPRRPTDPPSSQPRPSAAPRPEIPQSTPYGRQGSTPPQMAGQQHAQDPHQRAARQQQQARPPAMVPLQKDQHPSRKPVPQAGRPSQPVPARTQESDAQRPHRGQESYQQHGTQQQQQEQRQSPHSRLQQGAPPVVPNDKIPRPEGFQQPHQSDPGNNSAAPMVKQPGSMQQAHPPPPHEMALLAPFHDLKATAHPQSGQQRNEPSTQAYGAVEPVITTPQQQQPPGEPYRQQQQSLPRSPSPPPAAMSSSRRPLAPASISKDSTNDAKTPPSSSSIQSPAPKRAPLRTKPRQTPSPTPLTGESLLSTLMRGRPVPRLDARDPKHGNALVEGAYCVVQLIPSRFYLIFCSCGRHFGNSANAIRAATVAGAIAMGQAATVPDLFRESVERAGGLEEHVKGYLSYGRQVTGQRA